MSYSLAFSKAIITIVFVADKVRQGMFEFVPTKVLSESLNIPNPTVVKILQSLTRAGIIETREGARGGVRLAVKAESVTILDIFNAVENNKALFRKDFNLNVQGTKPTISQNAIGRVLDSAEQEMKNKLQGTTIAHLLEELDM
jgi:Rrf2 family protein